MKNKVLTVLGTSLIALALSACSFDFTGTEEWTYTSDDLEGSTQIFDLFFEKTLANTNQVAVLKDGNDVFLTEKIDGDKNYVKYGEESDAAETWTFINEKSEKIYAVDNHDESLPPFYSVGEDSYLGGRYVFVEMMNCLNAAADAQGNATYSGKFEGKGELVEEGQEEKSDATFTMTVTEGNNVYKMNGVAKNGLVVSFTTEVDENGEKSVYSLTVEYGKASVNVPDISNWKIGY